MNFLSNKFKNIIIFLLFFAIFFPHQIIATQAMRQYITNHQTKECAVFNAGDECERHIVPTGWLVLDYNGPFYDSRGNFIGGAPCPDGYAFVEDLEIKTKPVWEMFCLLPNHSGSSFTQYYFWSRLIGIIVLIVLIIFLIKKFKKRKIFN